MATLRNKYEHDGVKYPVELPGELYPQGGLAKDQRAPHGRRVLPVGGTFEVPDDAADGIVSLFDRYLERVS
jgi:hypothetical protein